jgi:peptidoglycan/xylan/chitin deacetylase (PgdA/CDA1 family)
MTVHAPTIDLKEVIRPTPVVVGATHRLLDILDEAGVHATFFVLGNVAETYPGLGREVVRCGHEIGNYTYSHELSSA